MSPKKQTGKLALCPEVGIRSLKDLTKDELIYCINAAAILVRRIPGCCAALRFPVPLRCGSLLQLHAARSS